MTSMAKNVLVTGSSRGIGRETAILLAKEGYNVAINYNKSEDKAKEVLEECLSYGVKAVAIKADVSDFKAVEKMFLTIIEEFGSIDVLINNAGITVAKQFQDYDPSEWYEIISTNLNGMYHCAYFALKDMMKRHEGVIINLSSIFGITGAAMEVPYSTSKGAVIAFTKSLAREFGYSGIRINSVAPGGIDTDMVANVKDDDLDAFLEEIPLGRLGKPIEIANLISFLVSDKASYITGQIISSNGGWLI